MHATAARALVVDDDAALRLLLRVNLELDGFTVREASTVAEARVAVADDQPDIVLLDVHLGGEQTLGLLDELRAVGIPVALVTGSVDVDLYRDRADAIVAKPFEPEQLIAVVRRLAKVAP